MRNFKSLLCVFISYLFLSLIFTYPLIFNLADGLVGMWAGDALNYIWNIDTFWKELVSSGNPFYTDRIFYPIGTSLGLHTYAPVISILGGLFLNNLVIFMNLLVILSLTVAAFCMYLLIKHLLENRTASFIGGLIYGFSPIMISFLLSQHYYFAFAAFSLPLGIFFLIKFFELNKFKYLIFLLILFWITFFIDYYTGILFLFLNAISFIYLIFSKSREEGSVLKLYFSKNHLFNYLKILLLFFIIPLILYIGLISSAGGLNYQSSGGVNTYPTICSANVLGYLLPQSASPHLEGLSQTLSSAFTVKESGDTPSYFIGFSFLIISIFTFIKWRGNRYLNLFSLLGIVVFLVTLGPIIRIGSNEILKDSFTPFYYFAKLPFMQFIDCPQRFPIGLQLSMAFLVAFFISKLSKKYSSISLLTTFLGIFLLEFGVTNLPVVPVRTPFVYNELFLMQNQKSILELPSGVAESKGAFGYDWSITGLLYNQLYWQTLHQHPRVGGYTSRLSPEIYQFYRSEPVISDLFSMSSLDGVWNNREYTVAEIDQFIQKFNLGYIVLSPNNRQTEFDAVIQHVFKDKIVEKVNNEGYILYQLR